MLVFASGFSCTGTVIAPRVVLTAAHCVEEDIADGTTGSGSVYFGNGGDPGDEEFTDQIGIAGMVMHRYYVGDASNFYYDIGLVLMREDAPAGVEPLAVNLDPLPTTLLGQTMRVVGFGFTDGNGTGAGTKRKVLVEIERLSATHIIFGDASKNICQGDSGGPAIVSIGGVETVVTVSSYGLTPQDGTPCENDSYLWRTDSFADSFLIPYLDAWTGPCMQDQVCVTEGCRTPDPDCDICHLDGICGSGCDALDFDCPVGGLAGSLCDSGDDCETRLCIEAADDPRVGYCSSACDPGAPIAETCQSPLTRCEASGQHGNVCQYDGITPSAQGAACEENGDCRSNLCYLDQGICVEPCGGGQPECAEGFACESVSGIEACVKPTDDGGCAVGAGGGGGAGWAGAFALGLAAALAGRRRRRCQ
jgi:MYXO-CTERM domain-containing protein